MQPTCQLAITRSERGQPANGKPVLRSPDSAKSGSTVPRPRLGPAIQKGSNKINKKNTDISPNVLHLTHLESVNRLQKHPQLSSNFVEFATNNSFRINTRSAHLRPVRFQALTLSFLDSCFTYGARCATHDRRLAIAGDSPLFIRPHSSASPARIDSSDN